MTGRYRRSQNCATDLGHLIDTYQDMLINQVDGAYQSGQMEADVYLNFLSKVCEATNREGILDHFYNMFNELVDYHEERLQLRIIKGAEYIELIGPYHQKYRAAMQKYDLLCERLQMHQESRRAAKRGGRERKLSQIEQAE